MKNIVRVGAAVAGAGIAVMVAAGTACVIAVTPIPNGNSISSTVRRPSSSRTPDWRTLPSAPPIRHSLSARLEPISPDIQRTFNTAATAPRGHVDVEIYGALHDPHNVRTNLWLR
ncbi:hypothetical protein [Rhodococcus sp. ACT016]|uniref:hypothetical protein n=1 Tax=Rhodococcus sp. ACT016 TaxID=3134808 RepID=UPI003D2A47FB